MAADEVRDQPDQPDEHVFERGYVARTLRGALILVVFVLVMLALYAQWWAMGPFLLGFGVSGGLLWGWDRFIRIVLTPERARSEKENQGKGMTGAIAVFALIKLPLVGVLLWWISRHWDTYRIAAFVGGFMLLHLVIAMRAASRLLIGTDAARKS